MAHNGFDIEIDEVTLAGARRGDVGAYERIYRKYHQPAFTVAVRVCRCRELAQEVTQEAFISAFRRIRQFRGDAPFWGWLRRVVVNHAISALRKLPRAEIVEFEDYQSWDPGQQEQMTRAMDLDAEPMVTLARAGRRSLLGIKGAPEMARIIRHQRAIAQYLPGHLARLQAMEKTVAQFPGLFLAGSSYRGISVNSCVKEAEAVAVNVLDHLVNLDDRSVETATEAV